VGETTSESDDALDPGREADAQADARKRSRNRRLTALILAGAFVFNPVTIAIFIRVAIAEAFELDGPSMAPGFQDGDRVVVWKFAYGLFLPFSDEATFSWAEPEIGDVVILRSPRDSIDVIKRVVGLPGDTLEMRDDVLIRNGVPVPRAAAGRASGVLGAGLLCTEETMEGRTWTLLSSGTSVPDSFEPLTVPAGHVFVLGDHRDRSADSRLFGTVPVERLKGLVGPHYGVSASRIECPSGGGS